MTEEHNEMPTALVRVSEPELAEWGERELIREMIERVMWLHPSSAEVGRAGVFAVCQLAFLAGAKPIPGTNEIHFWWDEKHERPVVMLGIGYDRRRAREVAGGIQYVPGFDPRPMNEQERLDYQIAHGVVASICRAYRNDDFEANRWMLGEPIAAEGKLFNLTHLWDMISVTSHAICGPSEYAKKGRTKQWTANKRAEASIIRQLIPTLEQPNPEARLAAARQNVADLDRMIPTEMTDEEAASVSAALFGGDVVEGESRPVVVVEPVELTLKQCTTPMQAWQWMLHQGVFEDEEEVVSVWMEMRNSLGDKYTQGSDMFPYWEQLVVERLEALQPEPEEENLDLDLWLEEMDDTDVLISAVQTEISPFKGESGLAELMIVWTDKFGDKWEEQTNRALWDEAVRVAEQDGEPRSIATGGPVIGMLPHPWPPAMWKSQIHASVENSQLMGMITEPQATTLAISFRSAKVPDDRRAEILAFLFNKRSLTPNAVKAAEKGTELLLMAEASALINAVKGAEANGTLNQELHALSNMFKDEAGQQSLL